MFHKKVVLKMFKNSKETSTTENNFREVVTKLLSIMVLFVIIPENYPISLNTSERLLLKANFSKVIEAVRCINKVRAK